MTLARKKISLFIRPGESERLAGLFEFLEQGELLSRDCARKQAELTVDTKTRRFLNSQAHQENYHSKVFAAGARLLSSRSHYSTRGASPVAVFRSHIENALRNNRLAESMLAQQVILEGLGEITLSVLNEGMNKRNMPLQRMRQIILRQEHAHHHFGTVLLENLIREQNLPEDSLRESSQKYLHSAENMLQELEDLFEFFDEDPVKFRQRFYTTLPEWLVQ